jgi:hypothetical protein
MMAARSRVGLLALSSAFVLLLAQPQPASARNIFEWLFGGFHHRESVPEAARAYANPNTGDQPAEPQMRADDRGPATAFCVRTCDGFHFTVHSNASASSAQMCHAFCPGSTTRLYSGGNIDSATAPDGTRYSSLDTANLYRKQLVAGCTCNGHDQYGLAHIDIDHDPTLRPGDMVSTKTGMVAVNASRGRTLAFTPIRDENRSASR